MSQSNALTDLLLNVFQDQLEVGQFQESSDFGGPLRDEQIGAIIHRSLGHLIRQHHDHLIIHWPVRDPDRIFRDRRSLCGA